MRGAFFSVMDGTITPITNVIIYLKYIYIYDICMGMKLRLYIYNIILYIILYIYYILYILYIYYIYIHDIYIYMGMSQTT